MIILKGKYENKEYEWCNTLKFNKQFVQELSKSVKDSSMKQSLLSLNQIQDEIAKLIFCQDKKQSQILYVYAFGQSRKFRMSIFNKRKMNVNLKRVNMMKFNRNFDLVFSFNQHEIVIKECVFRKKNSMTQKNKKNKKIDFVVNRIKEENTCFICFIKINQMSASSSFCKHYSCISCFSDWLCIQNKCPICRKTVEDVNLKINEKSIVVTKMALFVFKRLSQIKRIEEHCYACCQEIKEFPKIKCHHCNFISIHKNCQNSIWLSNSLSWICEYCLILSDQPTQYYTLSPHLSKFQEFKNQLKSKSKEIQKAAMKTLLQEINRKFKKIDKSLKKQNF